jgi:thermosome
MPNTEYTVPGAAYYETKGRQVQRNDIDAAKIIARIVRTSIGPRGMDKMLVDGTGDITITNDGATILKKIDVEHPAAKAMIEISKAIDNEVGDGTTSAVVLAGALLEKAEELLDKKVNPMIIADGYRGAAIKAKEILNDLATKVDPKDREWLTRVAKTSMATKLVGESDFLARIAVDAILSVAEEFKGKFKIEMDNIRVEKKAGGSIRDSKLVQGLIVDKSIVHSGMPRRIKDAKIVLLMGPLEIEKTEFDAKININSPEQMKMFLEKENSMFKGMVDKIVEVGANVVVCNKGIDDIAQHYLAKVGILAIAHRDLEAGMGWLSKATGGRLVTSLEELSPADLGYSQLVEERKVEESKLVFFEGCKNPKSVSILLRGGTQRVVDEDERSIHDALSVVKDVVLKPQIVLGAGSPEAEVASKLLEWSKTLSGRKQLAVQKYAEAVESIPLAIAENAGMNPIDTLVELRAKHSKGEKTAGVNAREGKIEDAAKFGVYEPLSVKEEIFSEATQAAIMILRVDDIFAKGTYKPRETKPPEWHQGGPEWKGTGV